MILSPEEDARLFWAKVDRSGGPDACWLWLKACQSAGYGVDRPNKVIRYAHRHAYTLGNGPIPEGLCVLHRCDNPPCCNPAHLFVGTKGDNNRDKVAKGRHWQMHKPEKIRRGEAVNTAKLTAAIVLQIRAAHAGGRRIPRIAEDFGVSYFSVYQIVRRKTWRHLPETEAA